MSRPVVFLGPTLPVEVARTHLDAVYLPPAGQGDVYRAANSKPLVIGLIDGYFDHVPAVWHKEILWAMAHGIHVVGGSSMGALRAAELASFGMQGVGRIYDLFASGQLEHDDEVAVAHGDASARFRLASEPMVNIRATLAKAFTTGLISEATHTALVALGRQRFYPERSYPRLLEDARRAALPESELGRLETVLREGRVDQKRDDAISVLLAVKDIAERGTPRDPVTYSLSHTEAWHSAIQEHEEASAGLSDVRGNDSWGN